MTAPRCSTASRRCAIVTLLLLASATGRAESPAELREEPVVIPTYQVGPAQRNPIFYSGRSY